MIEVETKIALEDKDEKEIRKKIKEIAKFSHKTKKIDDYFTLQTDGKYPKKSLRIRKNGKDYEINFKQRISYINGVWAKNESEFHVSDLRKFLELIKDFGFQKWLRKEKNSEIYKIENNFHIELNNVKHLGWFLEIEFLTNKKGISYARKKVLEIIKKLEIQKKQIVKDGYTKMLWEKGLLRKRKIRPS